MLLPIKNSLTEITKIIAISNPEIINNRTEYVNEALSLYFNSKGIIHESFKKTGSRSEFESKLAELEKKEENLDRDIQLLLLDVKELMNTLQIENQSPYTCDEEIQVLESKIRAKTNVLDRKQVEADYQRKSIIRNKKLIESKKKLKYAKED